MIWLKRLGIVLAVLLAVAALGVAWAWWRMDHALNRVYDIPLRPVEVRSDSEAVARGAHLASAIAKCTSCHGDDLGGRLMIDAGPLGIVYAPNLTRGAGGVVVRYQPDQLARAIRHGIRTDGRPLLIMPSSDFVGFSDEDMAALVAFVRSRPPVDRAMPPSRVRILGRALYALGKFPIIEAERFEHGVVPPATVAPAPTVAYGRYLGGVGGCIGCHGPGLSGGKIPGTPPDWKPAANLTPAGLHGWTEADFVTALRRGIRPNRTPIDSTYMPWPLAGQMDSTEMRAVWLFLQSVPSKSYGNR